MAEDCGDRLDRHDAALEQLRGYVAQQLIFNQQQLVHNQELHEMHADLRAACADLAQRLGRIEVLLERSLHGGTNGRDA
jgi:hypothetical protein